MYTLLLYLCVIIDITVSLKKKKNGGLKQGKKKGWFYNHKIWPIFTKPDENGNVAIESA